MKFPAGLAIILSISFTVLPCRVSAGGGQFSGVTNCFIGGRWVTVKGNCPASSGGGTPSGGGTSSGGGAGASGALYGGFYSLGYAFGQWLAGGGSDPQEEARRRAMMEELQRRQAEAERQQREEEARRLAGIYNRLARTLKLGGTPELQLKGSAGSSQGLKLKIGESAGGRAGIAGLPGMYLNGGETPYGVPGLPGIYTGGPGQGSGLSASGLKLKIGEESAAAAQIAQSANAVPAPASQAAPAYPAAQAVPFDPASMTPQQLADVAEMFSRLPPEEQAHLMAMAQKNAAGGPPVTEIAAPAVPGLAGQPLPAGAPVPLQQQAAASIAAATAPTPETASDMARSGFDSPIRAPSTVQLDATSPTPAIVPTDPAWPARTASNLATPPAPPKSQPGPASAMAPGSREGWPAGPPAFPSATRPADSGIDADAVAKAAMAKPTSGPKEAGPSPAPRLALKLSSGPHGKPPDAAPEAPRWRKAVDCAMDEIYVRIESLVPEGGWIVGELRREVERVIREAGPPPQHAADVTVIPIVLDRQVAAGDGATQQLLVQGGVHRYANDNIDVDVRSHISGAGRSRESTQTFLVLDNAGRVVQGEHSPAVGRCLAR